MAEYFEMKKRKTGEIVRVYSIYENMAVIFSPGLYKANGNGWERLKLSQLIPMDMPLEHKDAISKTDQNKAKERMKIVTATWITSDGKLWNHTDMEESIAHEIELMRKEREEANV